MTLFDPDNPPAEQNEPPRLEKPWTKFKEAKEAEQREAKEEYDRIQQDRQAAVEALRASRDPNRPFDPVMEQRERQEEEAILNPPEPDPEPVPEAELSVHEETVGPGNLNPQRIEETRQQQRHQNIEEARNALRRAHEDQQ